MKPPPWQSKSWLPGFRSSKSTSFHKYFINKYYPHRGRWGFNKFLYCCMAIIDNSVKIVGEGIKGKRRVTDEIGSITALLARTSIDLAVLTAGITGGLLLFGPRGKDLYASQKVDRSMKFAEYVFARYQHTRFRQALSRAISKGFIQKMYFGTYELTERGKQYYHRLLPAYKKKTKWNGKLWLITYDIPELKHGKRDMFRRNLETIGCRMVQESVWLSVKDPRSWLQPLVNKYRLKGKVLISCLGRDGSLGEEDMVKFIYRLFEVKQLERRYHKWIMAVKKTPSQMRGRHAVSYLGILNDDPVLPNDLLPENWIGDIAKFTFESEILPKCEDIDGYMRSLLY